VQLKALQRRALPRRQTSPTLADTTGLTECGEEVKGGKMGIFVRAANGYNLRTGVNVNLHPALCFQAEP
jgi:hypothetical protein